MNSRPKLLSVPLLRWTLGLVVILESGQFVFSSSAAHFFAKTGLPAWIMPAHGIVEILSAILFLVPITSRLGSYLLIVILRWLRLSMFCTARLMWEDLSSTP